MSFLIRACGQAGGAGVISLRNSGGSALATSRTTKAAFSASGPGSEVLWMVIEYLASLPPPGGVVGQLVAVGGDWSTVDRATAWLADLRGELQARRRGPEGTQRMAMA